MTRKMEVFYKLQHLQPCFGSPRNSEAPLRFETRVGDPHQASCQALRNRIPDATKTVTFEDKTLLSAQPPLPQRPPCQNSSWHAKAVSERARYSARLKHGLVHQRLSVGRPSLNRLPSVYQHCSPAVSLRLRRTCSRGRGTCSRACRICSCGVCTCAWINITRAMLRATTNTPCPSTLC